MLKKFVLLLLPVLFVGLILSACDRGKPESASKTVLAIPDRARHAADQADLVAIRSTVKTYRITNGRYPADLTVIAPLLNAPVDLSQFDYDPTTGSVSLKNAGSGQ